MKIKLFLIFIFITGKAYSSSIEEEIKFNSFRDTILYFESKRLKEDIKINEIKIDQNKEKINKNILSINEIDLLRKQLSSCWHPPAGAIIEKDMRVTISAKVQQNRKVIDSSIRIADTNISKSNVFYGPITESALRLLLHPDCEPLKLPENKYHSWKDLLITLKHNF